MHAELWLTVWPYLIAALLTGAAVGLGLTAIAMMAAGNNRNGNRNVPREGER